jgi:hypothetical protein
MVMEAIRDLWILHGMDQGIGYGTLVLGADPVAAHGVLMDLVKHRNAEYMSLLDALPPALAQQFLRLTVADPVVKTEATSTVLR